MTDSLIQLEAELKRIQHLPRTDVISQLMRHGNVDKLTKLKMKLTSECQKKDKFPKGEPFVRRRPKGQSVFSSLEERLASDIFELQNFLDTGCVTGEIKAMFKDYDTGLVETSTLKELEHFIDDSFNNTSNIQHFNYNSNDNNNTSTPGVGSDYFPPQRQRSENLARMEANLFSFKEKVEFEITDLLDKLSQKDKIIKKHGEDLCKLREENLNFKSRIAKLELQLQYPSNQFSGNSNYGNLTINDSNNNCNKSPSGEVGGEKQITGTSVELAECHTEATVLQNAVEQLPDKALTSGDDSTHQAKESYISYSHVVLRSPNNTTSAPKGNLNSDKAEIDDLTANTNNTNVVTESDHTESDGFIGVKRAEFKSM